MTHEFNNQSSQDERKAVLRNDSYFSRQQNTTDDAGGRYAKLTPATITGATSPQYPQLPASSPWSSGFDQNVEPHLGYAVDEMPAQEPTPSVASSAGVGSPVADVASFPASSAAGSSIKRRGFGE